jgi:hypothetical protein
MVGGRKNIKNFLGVGTNKKSQALLEPSSGEECESRGV